MENSESVPAALSIVGPGKVGTSIASAARRAGIDVALVDRSCDASVFSGDTVLLCVPDAAIEQVARKVGQAVGGPRLIGHVSGATSLEPLEAGGATEGCFSIHPLQTLPHGKSDLSGAPAAMAGSTPVARTYAENLARTLGMVPFAVAEGDRSTYHAAASMASNFLVALEESAAGLLEGIDIDDPREVLAPLVRRSLENWIEHGAAALTGPIARGDEGTVRRHREALLRARPDLLPLYDVLAGATRSISTATVPEATEGRAATRSPEERPPTTSGAR